MAAQHPSSADTLPVIDLSPMLGGVAQDKVAVGLALREACEHTGFFYVSGHGIDPALIQRVFAQSQQFFAQPMDAKLETDKAQSKANRGYEKLGGQTLEPGMPPDLKEGFYIGEELAADHPNVRAGRFNQGPNQWPAQLPDFKLAMQDYYTAMLALSERIMAGLALSLELPEDFFADFCTDPMCTLRLLHYPPQPEQPLPGEKGCGAHTDFGGITILLLDDKPGLQVWNARDESWIDAPPIPGAFVVNLGDMIARWTNDLYRSTLHRVINTSGAERYSVPFFYSGASAHEVRCLPGCLVAGEVPKYPATTVEQHLQDMYRRTYA
ncbi:isopenicillin N synthase family oxygenase [Pseudomonas neustonica]|uniref:2-oxoglutarate-dependent ethylene/succinate-forming enzyme n=1 Tax=Pseudomonas neustonica TaxID=2487346 RepID=A0ABX9XJY1_9PSED|nr:MULTISPECIES: 2-oxoglutarate and iron-dependent oxygenase domain-containing protein [Pseudomonas]ROZ84636.1 isopenicillin N synthase family oxygenase [Pseudomonas sp. SSM44]ROZ86440.1 isopenicillin N synthase family oxygenase [Pseudomonas neustonica]